MKDFKGKVAVITGAGRGIGRGIALRCAREGMNIVLAGYGTESITKTAADLEALGAETLIVQTDVSKLEDMENLAEKSYERFGAVHLLVNNAGVASPGSVLGSTMDDWNWVMNVNFYGMLYGVRTFVPRMIENGGEHVVNVSSLSGITFGGASYGVSKHAVVVMTESLYQELAMMGSDIAVSVYCPGWVSTEFDTIERSRPERFSNSAVSKFLTDENRKQWRASLAGGHSIDESADFLFSGLQDNKLYIGTQAFLGQNPDLHNDLQARTDNIINETNPEKPAVAE